MINKIGLKGYKLFKNYVEFEIKPITVIFGKNNSGKSSLTKFLHVFIETFEGNDLPEFLPFNLKYFDVSIGSEFRDLVYGRAANGIFEVKIFQDLYNIEKNIVFGNDTTTGFKPIILESTPSVISGFYQRTDYISSVRIKPEPIYRSSFYLKPFISGHDGENSYNKIIFESKEKDSTFLTELNEWFALTFEGWSINVNFDREPNNEIELINNNLKINIAETGQGISQFLPIAVRCFTKCDNDTICIVEEPELHMHSSIHGDLGELFVTNAMEDKNKRFVIETHSENLLLRIRKLIAEGKISPDNVRFYFIDFDNELKTSNILNIELNDKGEVSQWPSGIFEDTYQESIGLFNAQKVKS